MERCSGLIVIAGTSVVTWLIFDDSDKTVIFIRIKKHTAEYRTSKKVLKSVKN